MDVISVSLDDELREQVDRMVEDQNFTGRSDLFRTAIHGLIESQKDLDDMSDGTAVLMVKYDEAETGEVNEHLHHHRPLIDSQLHTHTDDQVCVEILVVDGPQSEIKQFWEDLRSAPGVTYIDIVLP